MHITEDGADGADGADVDALLSCKKVEARYPTDLGFMTSLEIDA